MGYWATVSLYPWNPFIFLDYNTCENSADLDEMAPSKLSHQDNVLLIPQWKNKALQVGKKYLMTNAISSASDQQMHWHSDQKQNGRHP